jgi:hypothetical protein
MLFAGLGQKRLEVLAHDLVEHGGLRPPSGVARRGDVREL